MAVPDGQTILEEEIDENYEPTQQGVCAQLRLCKCKLAAVRCIFPATARLHPKFMLFHRSPAEILEYAQWLGMDAEKEKVRREALAGLHTQHGRVPMLTPHPAARTAGPHVDCA